MLRQFTLQPNEDKRIQFEGQFLVVTQATGPIEMSIGGTTPITVDEKDRIHLRGTSPNDRAIRLKNISGGVNDIEIHTSDLLVDKRQGVDVNNAIQIAEDQRIGIDPQANIVQSIVQNPIKIDKDENTIKIEKNQCVGIDPKKNLVNVLHKRKDFKSLPTIEFMAGPGTPTDQVIIQNIPENKQRDLLILTADSNNFEAIWLGGTVGEGIPLFAGERLFIESCNKINLAALTDHKLYAAQVLWVD